MLDPFRYSVVAFTLIAVFNSGTNVSLADDKGHLKPVNTAVKGPMLGTDARINSLLIDAWNAVGKNKIRLALDLSETILRSAPNNGQALLFKGFCLYKLDRPERSIDCIRRALEILPDSGRNVYITPNESLDFSYYTLAAALTQANRQDEAVKVLDKAMALFGDRAFLYAERGHIYLLMDRPDKALADYNSEIKLGEIDGTINRGKLFLHLKKPEQAVLDFNTAIAKQPSNSRLYAMRADAYKMLGKLDLAKRDYEKSNSLGLERLME